MIRPSLTVIPGGRDGLPRAGGRPEMSRTSVAREVRAVFPDGWPALLAEVYGPVPATRSAEIAADFGVTDRAARDWVGGITGPRGAAVVVALRLFPEAAGRHLGMIPLRRAA